jgi:hypothetical protein
MASKKTRSKKSGSKKSVAKGPTVGGGKGKSKPAKLRTQFMWNFTAKFIGDPAKIKDPAPPPQTDPWPDPEPKNPPSPSTRVWPVSGQKMPGILADYATFVNVLMTVGNHGALPPPAPGSLAAQILQFLNQDPKWPDNTEVPPKYALEKPTVHLVEIAVILDRLLQAINSFDVTGDGAGGGGSGWPPH